jgi:hypothetical protein
MHTLYKSVIILLLLAFYPIGIFAEDIPVNIESKEESIRKLESAKKSYQLYVKIVNDPSTWVFISDSQVHDKKLFIKALTLGYTDEILQNGKKFNADELAERIKLFEEGSRISKAFIRETTMPEISKAIEALEKKISMIPPDYELSGCWLLTVGRGVSIINVSQNQHKIYYGILTKNKLRYYKQGDTVFEVTRQTGNTFTGREFTYTQEGEPLINNLKILMLNHGNSLTYTSDGSVTMNRCKENK